MTVALETSFKSQAWQRVHSLSVVTHSWLHVVVLQEISSATASFTYDYYTAADMYGTVVPIVGQQHIDSKKKC